jgi:hypothetical protein
MSAIFRQTYGQHNLNSQVENSLNLAVNCYRSLSDTSIGMSGMSGYKYRYFINNLMKQLSSPKYLEVGVMAGSSLCAAIDGVNGVEALAIDNFSLGSSTVAQVEAAVAQVVTSDSSVTILDKDFTTVNFTGRGPFNVYLYDIGREQTNYNLSLVQARSALADDLVFIVGDWDHAYGGVDSVLNAGIRASIQQAGYNIQYHANVQSGGYYESSGNPSSEVTSTPWQNGYGIFVLSKSAVVAPVEVKQVVVADPVVEQNYEV